MSSEFSTSCKIGEWFQSPSRPVASVARILIGGLVISDPKTKHSQKELDAWRAKYPSKKDMTMSTVLFAGEEPMYDRMVAGSRYHELNLLDLN